MFRPDFQDILPMGLVIPGRPGNPNFTFVQGTKDTPLPLKSTSVTANLTGYVVAMSSLFKYSNDTHGPVEVLFRFPVDESYAVVALEAMIGERKVKATLKEKEEAKQDYDDALASGFTAALGEEKTGDIFSISLGNLPPQCSAEIHLELVGELPLNAEGGVHFTLPSVLKHRHVPAGSSNPLQMAGVFSPLSNSQPQQQATALAVFEFSLHVFYPSLISSVTSPTHSVLTQRNEEAIVVSLSQPQSLENDLVISVVHADPHKPSALTELGGRSLSQRSYMGAPAVMLNFFPKFDTKRAACEFIFLIDRSGSMRGGFMRSAKETLKLFLKSIPPSCHFNIIGFGSTHQVVFPGSVAYTQASLDHAVCETDRMFANLGGTELLPPLRFINSQPSLSGLPRQVFVLTDGAVSNTAACIQEVKNHISRTRVFTFGIGSGASTELVRGLAKAGNGKAEFIHDGERMQPKVIASLKRALQPAVTDFEVVFDIPSGFEAMQAPETLPVLYNGDKTTVFGILKSKALSDDPLQTSLEGTATLRGKVLGQPFEYLLPFRVSEPSSNDSLTVVHKLAAKALIQDGQSISSGWKKQEIIDLSIESSVISSHTAYIAVDESQDKPIEGAVKVWDVLATAAQQNIGGGLGGFSLSGQANFVPSMGGLGGFSGQANGGLMNLQLQQGAQQMPTMQMIGRSGGLTGGNFGGTQKLYSPNYVAVDMLVSPNAGIMSRSPQYSPASPQYSPTSPSLFQNKSQSRGRGQLSSQLISRSSTQSPLDSFSFRCESSPSLSGGLFGAPPPLSGGLFGAPPPPSGGLLFGAPPPSAMYGAPLVPTPANQSSGNAFGGSAFGSSLSGSTTSRGDQEPLTKIISLQRAEGFWLLEEVAAQILSRPLAELTGRCPVECDGRAWATALVLACLEKRFAAQRDEWELVGLKGEVWLEHIMDNSALNNITQAAKNCI